MHLNCDLSRLLVITKDIFNQYMSQTDTSVAVVKKVDETTTKEGANKRIWTRSSDSYMLDDASQQMEQLPLGVYRVQNSLQGLYLKNTEAEFTFDYKIYGTETKFIDRVIRTYHGSKGNMGVLLNGIKGTGKSVTAKLICNKMKLPVIVVSEYYDALPTFLNDIHEDVIVFIDEYEKLYSDWKTSSILSVMDGVLSGKYRRMFILTTNDLHINENMLQRPSRIYYLKTYDNIEQSVVDAILDDMLDYPEFRDDIVKFVGEMNIITIDLVKAIIHEVNLHGETPYAFKEIFNVRNHKNELYNIIDITDTANPKTMAESVRVDFQFTDVNMGRDLYLGNHGKRIGTMMKVFDKETALFENSEYETLNVSPNDMDDEDYDKLEEMKKAKVVPKLIKVRRVIRKEPSNSYSNLRQYII